MSSLKFKRESLYRGEDFIHKLSKQYITICGAGALGSNLVESLAKIGFPNLKVLDFDRVEETNISTQVYGNTDVGSLKVDALQNKIFRNVGTEIEVLAKKIIKNNIKNLLKNTSLCVDCFDNHTSRKIVQEECLIRKIPCIHIGVHGEGGYGEVIWTQNYKVPRDIDGDLCDQPLARNLIMLVVSIASEEILDFCLADDPRKTNWSLTLKDLQVLKI